MIKGNVYKTDLRLQVKGILNPLPYEDRLPSGDWSAYFGKYQTQKYGAWDSNSCWALAGINCVEDQLEYLWKNGQFSIEAKAFFSKNGYIDSEGDFSLSERFIEILSGVKGTGNASSQFWVLAQKYGLLPRSQLTYSVNRTSAFTSYDEFANDYFDPKAISPAMLSTAKQFLTYVNIAFERVGSIWSEPDRTYMQAALYQAPLQIGIPVSYSWNNVEVNYDGNRNISHSVELYRLNPDGTFAIFDQYEPHLKTLSKDYWIPSLIKGVVTAVPQASPVIDQKSVWPQVWKAVSDWFFNAFGGERARA